MSSSSSSSGAAWKQVPSCDCGYEHFRAVKMEWQTHPMSAGNQFKINTAKTLLAPLTFGWSFWGAPDTAHHAVLVYFVCGECDKENRHTYDLFDTGKEHGSGYYGRYYKICRATKLNVSYEKVQEVYDGMWENYDALDNNCEDWARNFYNRVNDKSKEAAANRAELLVMTAVVCELVSGVLAPMFTMLAKTVAPRE